MTRPRAPMYEMEILIDILRGIYSVTTWYTDGTMERREISKGPLLVPKVFS